MPRASAADRNGTLESLFITNPQSDSRCAAVILAGGDGSRLSSFTREVFGYHLPKQFFPLFEGQTLLERTMRRVALLVPPAQTVTVLNRAHEEFYTPLLRETPAHSLLIQPENRGTTSAILCAVRQLVERGHTGAVAIFPSDHYVSDDFTFMRHVSAAFRAVNAAPQTIALLGIPPDGPETEYGWIEPGAPLEPADPVLGNLNRVIRFWEKPSREIARDLYRRRCLWNSFVLVANAATLLSLIAAALPELYRQFTRIRSLLDATKEERALEKIFRDLPSVDFSGSVVAEFPAHFSVLPVTGVSWSDLGDPDRMLAAISRHRRISGGKQNVARSQAVALPAFEQQTSRYKAGPSRQ
jgi:mannose-1-phosphate guanylyltransferase